MRGRRRVEERRRCEKIIAVQGRWTVLSDESYFGVSATRLFFFFSSRRRHTRFKCDWSSDVCSSDLFHLIRIGGVARIGAGAGLAAERAELLDLARGQRHADLLAREQPRSEERRVGKEWRYEGSTES